MMSPADLPFSVAAYNTVVFAGSAVYVATDKGGRIFKRWNALA